MYCNHYSFSNYFLSGNCVKTVEKTQVPRGQVESQSGPSWSTQGQHLGTSTMIIGIEMAPLVATGDVCGEFPPVRPGHFALSQHHQVWPFQRFRKQLKSKRLRKLWAVSVISGWLVNGQKWIQVMCFLTI